MYKVGNFIVQEVVMPYFLIIMHINKKSNFRRDVNYMAIIVMGTILLLIADNYMMHFFLNKYICAGC